ncbi:hypothetical protein WH87_04525 [Devosia epidermidihirudinis]|uniref:Beta-lactamase-related domain-containing protein n=1 Tax=Devosia epidermidihirudinis TaxID=1293439 RepID=A0A0F5QFH8_9HYPH|nr:serine hydrolase domain-containing protein [Devosia epidermidihirudinis]KKC39473.1 hypothetical protein WH87_04525 [Devosia epidermidihirudinis]
MTNSIDRVIDDAISNKTIVGTEVLVAKAGRVIYRRAAGHFDREAGAPMPENAIYRLASVTKPIVAATALAMMDRGLLSLDDRVDQHLPYFQPKLDDGEIAPITLRHLLTHTSGLGYEYPGDPKITTGMQDTDLDHEANLTRIAQQKLMFAPGTAWNYSVATDVLGAVLAKAHGGMLGEAVLDFVTGPLGMTETGFFVASHSRLAPPYADNQPEPVPMGDNYQAEGSVGNSTLFSPIRMFNPKAFQSGGAGMAGTASDILKLLEALRLGGKGIIQPQTVAEATSSQIVELSTGDAGMGFGYLGAVVLDPAAADTPEAVGTFTWGGIYGHSWLVDPANEMVLISMSNTAVEGCNGKFPRNVRNAAYAEFA